MYDIIIIGAGPAGLTAGIYALRANKKIKIFESQTIGGHITSSPLVSNYPGFKGVSGMEIADNFYEQLTELGGDVDYEAVEKVIPGDPIKVITEEGEYESSSVIIATGTTYRMLNLPNEENLIGNGISFCVTCDGAFYHNKDVAVVGGSNTATIDAVELSKIANKVYLIVRKDKLKGEKVNIEYLEKCNNVEIIFNSNVTEYLGKDELTGIIINNEKEIKVDGLFLAIGQLPNVNIIDDVTSDESGFINSKEDCETNYKGIFVAGDVRSKKVRQLTTATSDGTIACLNAISYIDNK